MRFSKLRIVGFKSFVEPMEFIIGNGLTGVVGPNGCGKSNLVEALRWVMGENSYKNMRASGMDDVIFSGSLNRPARNTAEVTLFLENQDKTAPAAFNDADTLEVSRRIEREQGSNYKINARDVRARDVQLLFADASTGARSPAMVRQGQIGELIAAKPTSRRQILEEAAGISGLHSRRHEAEIRLRAAEQNLERLEDVLVQIDGQLDNLKRQSRQATRYRNLSSEIRATEASILYIRWTEARDALGAAESQFAEAQKQVNEATALQAESARVQAIAAHKLPELRDDAAKAGAALQRLVIARNELDAEERRVKERLQDLERRMVQLAEDIRREQSMVSENDEVLERLSEERAELLEENETVLERTEAAQQKVGEAEEAVRSLETRLSDLTAAEARANAERRQLERAVADSRQRADRLVAQAQEAQQALNDLQAQMADQDGIADNREALELAEEALAEAEAAVEEAETATREARDSEQAARGPLSDARQLLQGLETEARTLEQVLNVNADQDHTPVVEQIRVEPGFETALGAALGEDLDASLDEAAAVRWGGSLPHERDPDLPGDVPSLADRVEAPGELTRRLRQIGLVSQDAGPGLRASLAPGPMSCVDRRRPVALGRVLSLPPMHRRLQRSDWPRKTGWPNSPTRSRPPGNPLPIRHRRWRGPAASVRQAVEFEQIARSKVRDGQRRSAAAREALAAAERAVSQIAAKKEAAQDRAQRLGEEAELAREQVLEAETLLEEAPDATSYRDQIEELQGSVSEARSILAEARALAEGLTREQQMRDRRLEAIAREYDSWKTRAANAAQQISILKERQEEAEEERAELIEAPEDIELKRRELFSAIAKAEEAKKEKDDRLSQAELDLSDVDRAAKVAMEAMAGARANRRSERKSGSKRPGRARATWNGASMKTWKSPLRPCRRLPV